MTDFPTTPATQTFLGIRTGFLRLFPIALFVIPFGIAFGVAAIDRGLNSLQSFLLSLTAFSGAAQFAALDFWDDPLPSFALFLTIFAVSARHILMGAALAPWIKGLSRTQRLFTLCFLSDANFADSHRAYAQGEKDTGILIGGGVALWLAWVIGTLIGAVGGSRLGDLDRFGFDVVMLTFFTAMLIDQWRGKIDILPAVIAAVTALVGSEFLPAGWGIVLAAAAGGLAGGFLHDR